MPNTVFLFDLDATITKEEILPMLAREVGCFADMQRLTAAAMQSDLPFAKNFAHRVAMLHALPVSRARMLVGQMPIHEHLAQFLREHRAQCYIATGNLDVWLPDLLLRMDMQGRCFCSQAVVENDRIISLANVLDKGTLPDFFKGRKVVAVGDGSNDAPMLAAADIAIGFGAVSEIAPAVKAHSHYNLYTEAELCTLLKSLL